MSIRVMAEVFEASLEPTEKLVLLAMADHADSSGGSIFPGNKRLASKCGYSERTIERTLSKLKDQEILEIVSDANPGKGRAREWQINTQILPISLPPGPDKEPVTDE